MRYLGDFIRGQTVRFMFNTQDAAGASATFTGTTVSVYKDANTTQSTTGVTLTKDVDGVTGVHLVEIALSDSFYADACDFSVVLAGATIDSQSVSAVLGHFSIRNRSLPTVLLRCFAQAGGTSTQLVLASSLSLANDILNGCVASIVAGTGAGQSRVITGFVGATDTATVDTAWVTNPDATSLIEVTGQGIVGLSAAQVAAAVLNAETASHTTSGTVGKAIGDINTKAASLTFTSAGKVDANVQAVNDVDLTGNGVSPKFGV